jgi:hypothetical protein
MLDSVNQQPPKRNKGETTTKINQEKNQQNYRNQKIPPQNNPK